MKFQPLQIPEVFLITPTMIARDERGWFFETHRVAEFLDGIHASEEFKFVQANISCSNAWTLRGLHYQYRHPQGKLVRCLMGRIYDVAVDVREGSPTFGKYVGHLLDDKEHQAIWVPPGFAHGYLSLDQPVLVHYETTSYYSDAHAQIINWNDQRLGVVWPIQNGQMPIISQKDRAFHPFNEARYCEYQPPHKARQR